MNHRDSESRSVGELLADCDAGVRDLLTEPDRLSAVELLRSWPELVQAGQELLAVTRPPLAVGWSEQTRVDEVGVRLRLIGDGLNVQLARRAWPGQGAGDARVLAVSNSFVRVHDRVERHWRQPLAGRSDVAADTAAVRARVLHTLYVATHAVVLAVRQEAADARLRSGGRTRDQSRRLAALRYAEGRLETAERMLVTPVYRVFPAALAGEHVDAPRPGRLAAALWLWELEAHRTLARSPQLATVMEVSRVQAAVTAMTRTVLSAVSADASVDGPLAAAAAGWTSLHAGVRDVTEVSERATPPALAAAGAELIAAFSQVLTTGTEKASTGAIQRAITDDARAALFSGLATQVDLATMTVDALVGDVFTASLRTAEGVDPFDGGRVGASGQAAVLCGTRTAGGAVSVPPQTREVLIHRAAHVRRVAALVSSIPLPCRLAAEVAGEQQRATRAVEGVGPRRLAAARVSR